MRINITKQAGVSRIESIEVEGEVIASFNPDPDVRATDLSKLEERVDLIGSPAKLYVNGQFEGMRTFSGVKQGSRNLTNYDGQVLILGEGVF